MEVDRGAPVFAEGQISIAVDPQRLWDIMADFEGWPSWNPDVDSVKLEGPVADGSVFRWKSGSANLVSTIRHVERPRELGWTGQTMGIRAAHVWRFEHSGEGAVASMEESFDGGVAKLFRKRLQRQLDATTSRGLEALKRAAERPAPE